LLNLLIHFILSLWLLACYPVMVSLCGLSHILQLLA
jgi:hypothetical protein